MISWKIWILRWLKLRFWLIVFSAFRYANKHLLASVKAHFGWQIPDEPLFIKIYMSPQERDGAMAEIVDPVTFRMHLFKTTYSRWKLSGSPKPHVELFTREESKAPLEIILKLLFLAATVLFVSGTLLVVWSYCQKTDMVALYGYTLMDVEKWHRRWEIVSIMGG